MGKYMNDDNTQDNFQQNNPDDTNPIEDMKSDEQLPEDNATPFSPPADVQDHIGPTHQATDDDSNTDSHEKFDAGTEAAAGVELSQSVDTNEFNPFSLASDADSPQENEPDLDQQPPAAA